jgi:solute carrier family 8 (sodium/calcium exchanger)
VLKSFIFLILEVTKVLTKLAKYAGCESLLEWIKPCVNHLYWSAMTTLTGNGNVIVAKFKSFLGHVKNQHSGLF